MMRRRPTWCRRSPTAWPSAAPRRMRRCSDGRRRWRRERLASLGDDRERPTGRRCRTLCNPACRIRRRRGACRPRPCADGAEMNALSSLPTSGGDWEKRTGVLRSKPFAMPAVPELLALRSSWCARPAGARREFCPARRRRDRSRTGPRVPAAQRHRAARPMVRGRNSAAQTRSAGR